MQQEKKLISIVTPFYNEGPVVECYHAALCDIIDRIEDFDFEIICVDDGSSDNTLSRLLSIVERDKRFQAIELSRNFGKEAALTAGIDNASGDAVIPIDADLQDPPEIITQMIEEWKNGADVVVARRANRDTDSLIKRQTAQMFYKVHNSMSNIKIPNNVGDFRLMDKSVVHALKQLPERQRFMKGLFAWVGFKNVTLDYKREKRVQGSTKFSWWKLWNFALEGITSFSTAPLRISTYFGLAGAFVAGLYAIFIISRTLIYGVDLPGYASTLTAIVFFGCLNLISNGIIGEYLGRIYMETKQRPTYLVRKHYKA